jgi:hypothetical protein
MVVVMTSERGNIVVQEFTRYGVSKHLLYFVIFRHVYVHKGVNFLEMFKNLLQLQHSTSYHSAPPHLANCVIIFVSFSTLVGISVSINPFPVTEHSVQLSISPYLLISRPAMEF